MPISPLTLVLTLVVLPLATALLLLASFMIYAAVRYAPIIGRIFEEKPLFLPLRLTPELDREDVRFNSRDGLDLAGSYFRATTSARVGVLVFCHEYLSDRWSFQPYANALRNVGYDIFTFDFRNHGASASDPAYRPLQWVTDHEVRDLEGAISYLRTRSDRDPAGFGLFGISRGGSTALVVGERDPGVWGVVTDGAFPTHGTMLAYIMRWAEIYVSNPYVWKRLPGFIFGFMAWTARIRSERRLNCRFPNVERAVSRLAPRPWLMIHGEKDAYIGPAIARKLYDEAGDPKEIWIVPRAKHNRCREVAPEEYALRVLDFLRRFAPRRELAAVDRTESTESAHSSSRDELPDAVTVPVAVAEPMVV